MFYRATKNYPCKLIVRLLILVGLCGAADSCVRQSDKLPQQVNRAFADAHIHYNWDQKEIIGAKQVIDILTMHQVGMAVVAGTPSELALELREAGADWIVPIFSPYTHELGKRDWYKNEHLPAMFEQALTSKRYFGLGEVHFMSGFPPRLDNPVFVKLLAIAKAHQVPSLIHIDSADSSLFQRLCQDHPDQTLVFAHAGGNLGADAIRSLLQTCKTVWMDLSARDPWRYGGLTDSAGTLLNAWRQLILDFPERFITGTDPVWRVTRTQSWDQPDDGWDHYDQLYQYHRGWLSQLPADVAQKIAWDNPRRVYTIE